MDRALGEFLLKTLASHPAWHLFRLCEQHNNNRGVADGRCVMFHSPAYRLQQDFSELPAVMSLGLWKPFSLTVEEIGKFNLGRIGATHCTSMCRCNHVAEQPF